MQSTRYGELQNRYSEVAEEVARLTEVSRESPDRGVKNEVVNLRSSVTELESQVSAKDDELHRLRDEKLRLEGENDRQAQEISTLRALKESSQSKPEGGSGGDGGGANGGVSDPGGGLEALIKRLEEDFAERSKQLREELQYARSKCDDKDKKLQQLAMDKSMLTVEVETLRESCGGWRNFNLKRVLEAILIKN